MKTVGKRMSHLRENVLKITMERMKELTGVSRTPLTQIESGEIAPRALEKVIASLHLNPTWVHEGKGSIWLTGTDEENVARIKSMKSGAQTGAEPWKDEAYQTMKTELDRAREREDRMQRIIDRLLNGGTNFRKAPDYTSLKLASGF